ncbi:hypothetical protein GP486_002335 [Trichoglossum hirsutum]|uniref:Uncharacterized protein n=1 Tax=Trichoglossum hirsutum TaxID=265104 RepID=A0A9P8RS65_9PEZI|nr:hypothetical protein GP486_002335 [Trichoglossum hirsutum]
MDLWTDGYLPTSHNTTTKVTRWDPVNRYGYNPSGLFIPYGLACLFTFATVLLGAFSYSRNGVLPDKKFQDIVSAAGDQRIIHVVRDRKKSITAENIGGQLHLRPGTGPFDK